MAPPGRTRLSGAGGRHIGLCEDVAGLVLARAVDCDLLILGINRVDRNRRVFGPVITRLVDDAPGAVMVIGQRE